MAEKILSVENLAINFKTDHGILKAVRDVSFDLEKGETLCIVGESGSGKSVTSKAIMGILSNNAIIENGSILYRGENLLEVSEDEFYKIRGHKIGMIFQDPLSSLNPIVRIGKQITEATLINSNKLKLMYSDLISDDLIAYKNTLAKRDIKIGNEKKIYQTFVQECDNKLSDKELSNEEKAKVKEELKARKAALKELIKTSKEETKVIAAPLKEKLNKTKAEAKVKVKEGSSVWIVCADDAAAFGFAPAKEPITRVRCGGESSRGGARVTVCSPRGNGSRATCGG